MASYVTTSGPSLIQQTTKVNKMSKIDSIKEEAERLLTDAFIFIGCDRPCNMKQIIDFMADDVDECADEEDWGGGDIAIAFRRFLESSLNED